MDAVSGDQERAIRKYRRLWISRNDLDEAKAAIDFIDRSGLHRDKGGNHPIGLIILTTALVVSYARPFIAVRGNSDLADSAMPGSVLRVLTKKQRQLHDLIVHMRQKEVAHSDAEVLELSFRVFPNGDSAISRTTRDPFLRRELSMLRSIIRKIDAEIEKRCDALRHILPHDTWL